MSGAERVWDHLHGYPEPSELADVDLAYDVPPLGVRLEADDSITVLAPLGTDDLLGMVHRRNPARVSIEEYERRLRDKRIQERWPRVRVSG